MSIVQQYRTSTHGILDRSVPAIFTSSADYLLLFTGEAFCSVASNSLVLAGTGTAFLNTMSCALTSLPYRFLLAPLSGRSVEPSREIPANNPRARE